VITTYALESWHSEQNPNRLEIKPGELAVKPGELAGKPRDLAGKPGEMVSRNDGISTEIPHQIRKVLDGLGGKAKPHFVIDAIMSLLKWRELSLAELAAYLERNPEHIRSKYLSDLLRGDLIQQSNPEKPNDPNQKYRARKRCDNTDGKEST